MKVLANLSSILILVLLISGCGNSTAPKEEKKSSASIPETGYFGKEFNSEESIPAAGLEALFEGSDTVLTTLSGQIASSCKHSGCWMDLDMGGGDMVHVTFKDDSFTIPLNAEGKNATILGVATREMIPVETLQNYAREEGKSEEEVALITGPAYAYEFIASGVLIEE